MTPPRHAVLLLFLTTLLLPVGHAAAMVEVAPPTTARAVAPGYRLFGTLNRASPVFEPGEPMVFTLTLMNGDRPVVGDTLKWTRSGDDGVTESGVAELTDAGVQVVASTDTPGFVRIYATVERGGEPLRSATEGNEAGKPLFFDGGACVAPEALHPVDEPEDFDAFWASQKELLATVPMKVLEMNELEGDDRVRAWDVKIACAGGAPVSGYLVMPRDAGPGSLEAEVSFQGYGVKSAYLHLAGGRERISLVVNAHGVANGQDEAYYHSLRDTVFRRYGFNDDRNASRERSFFNGMLLRAMRALEFVKSRPEWNGRDLRAAGGSQGGMQSLAAAGLDPDVTSCYAWSPWNCDLGRTEKGRLVGDWHVPYTPELRYFDPVYFAQRAAPECGLEILANLGDYVCPPSGVWMAYNQWAGPKTMAVRQGCTHSHTMPGYREFTFEQPVR